MSFIKVEALRKQLPGNDVWKNWANNLLMNTPVTDRKSALLAGRLGYRTSADALHHAKHLVAGYREFCKAAYEAACEDTVIVVGAWLDDEHYRNRTIRFIKHHENWHSIIVLDNGSLPNVCEQFSKEHLVEVINLQPRYPRYPGETKCVDAWRITLYLRELLKRYKKVIATWDDFFILSDRLTEYIDSLQDGWTCLWCERHCLPETALAVLVRGCSEYEEFAQTLEADLTQYVEYVWESVLPITRIATQFVGDRYGEFNPVPPLAYNMDWWCQAPPEHIQPLKAPKVAQKLVQMPHLDDRYAWV